jgi:hypothetical protein
MAWYETVDGLKNRVVRERKSAKINSSKLLTSHCVGNATVNVVTRVEVKIDKTSS